MPADQLRSQWDFGVNATIFAGKSDITVALGKVWDLNKFVGTNVHDVYARGGYRIGW